MPNSSNPAYDLDDGPGKVRLGLIALANDQVIERDMALLNQGSGALIYTGRIAFSGDCSLENLASMSDDIVGATRLINPGNRLDGIIFGCTSGTVALGSENIVRSVRTVRPGIPVVDPLAAVSAAVTSLSVQNIALLAPYNDEVTHMMAQALEDRGLRVVATRCLGITQSAWISRVTPGSIYDWALAVDTPDAEALFIACTDFRSLDVLSEIEGAIGKPVVTSNQALFWHATREAGLKYKVAIGGRLLSSQ